MTDVLFDDAEWTVRWLVVDTGTWLPGRKVLVPPAAVERPEAATRAVQVNLTREQVKESPPLETDAPVSQQHQADVHEFYRWTPYWQGYGSPYALAPAAPPPGAYAAPNEGPAEPQGDPHLRSVDAVTGLYVAATDGDIGHTEEFLIDDVDWRIRYLVVDTRNWWPGKKVLVSPDWVRAVAWHDARVGVDLTREQVKGSPQYDPDLAADRAYEVRLYEHYGLPPYWY